MSIINTPSYYEMVTVIDSDAITLLLIVRCPPPQLPE